MTTVQIFAWFDIDDFPHKEIVKYIKNELEENPGLTCFIQQLEEFHALAFGYPSNNIRLQRDIYEFVDKIPYSTDGRFYSVSPSDYEEFEDFLRDSISITKRISVKKVLKIIKENGENAWDNEAFVVGG